MAGFANVMVTWTAPADDGIDPTTGPAAGYDMRYYNGVLTEALWESATKVSGIELKAVGVPGTTEEFLVQGLRAGEFYSIGLKVKDAAGNWSGLSNVLAVTPADVVPPAMVRDFRLKA